MNSFLIRILTLLALWSSLSGFLDSASSLNDKGNKLYNDKHDQSALASYQNAQTQKPNQPEILYNLGTTLYQVDSYQDAASYLQKSIKGNQTGDKSFEAKNWYNYGNSQYRLGNFDESIAAYKKTLELDPNDKDAKHNLEVVLKKKGQFESKRQDLERQHPKKNPEQKKNQSQDQNKDNQGSGGKSQKKDEQSQGDQGNQKDKSGSGSGSSQGQEDQNKQDQDKDGKQDQSKDQKDQKNEQNQPSQQSSAGKDNQKEPQDEKGNDETEKKTPKAADEQKQAQNVNPGENQETPSAAKEKGSDENQNSYNDNQQYYQGQMSKSDAMRILTALQDSEKETQFQARRPKSNSNKSQDEPPPAVDW